MPEKPTYEELEQRNKELEKEAAHWKRIEEELRKREKRFESITNSIEELFVILDQNFKVQLINKTLSQAYNVSLGDYAGKHCYDLFYGRNDICEGCPAIKVLNEGKVTRAALRYRPDGRIFDRTAYPFIEDNGDITGIIVIGVDITEQKQAEEKLRKSEEKYRLLVENQTDMIVTFDTEGHLLFVSPSYLETFDKAEDELIGKRFMPFIHEEDRETVAKAIANVHKPPYIAYVEERVMTKDGWRWQAWLNTAILNEQGKVESIVAVGRDITKQKQAEEKLRKSEEKYRLLVESTSDWIWMCDLKSRITFSNNSVKEILGYEIHEILGKTALSLIHTEDRKSVQKWFQKAKKQKRGWRGSVINWQHKDKSIRFLETIAEPIFDDKGNLSGYSGIDRDVTPRILSEIALQKAHYELQEKTIRLEVKKNSLEELNTAMKVLLKKREEDKTEIESNVLKNVKELIEPYFEKIKKTKLDDQQKALLSIMESNINEIVSPFTRKMSLKYLNLTPTEIRIANLIRHGSSTKKIAEIMNVSPRTVETHRKNIRRKIGLDRKRANLRSHLLSLH
ncbi:MAG: PAS domain S-box protein [Desulfobacterales bacterium]|jgi:PAS domain S-box-containing protein